MKPTNLNPLFIDLIRNFAHLVERKAKTKKEFLKKIQDTYSLDNPKTHLFYLSAKKSDFDTVRLKDGSILFNH